MLSDFAAHKFNFPQGNAGKTVLVESLVQRGYVEPYDDERVVHYFIPGTGNDSNLLIVFYVQIMPDDFVMQLHRF